MNGSVVEATRWRSRYLTICVAPRSNATRFRFETAAVALDCTNRVLGRFFLLASKLHSLATACALAAVVADVLADLRFRSLLLGTIPRLTVDGNTSAPVDESSNAGLAATSKDTFTGAPGASPTFMPATSPRARFFL